MQKLTAICPTEDTAAVLATLRAEHGVSKVMRTRSVVGDTAMDMINAYVRRRSSDSEEQACKPNVLATEISQNLDSAGTVSSDCTQLARKPHELLAGNWQR